MKSSLVLQIASENSRSVGGKRITRAWQAEISASGINRHPKSNTPSSSVNL
jgi:hypothetical protein